MNKILVTGANRGIGYAITENLIQKKGNQLILACRNLQKAKKVYEHFKTNFPSANLDIAELDVDREDSIKNLAQRFADEKSKINVLINNAGITCEMNQTKPEVAKSVMQTNFFGPISLTESLLPHMEKKGKILFCGGFVGKLKSVRNQDLKKRFSSEDLSKEQLFKLMQQFLDSVEKKDYKEKGWPTWFYTVSKIGINYYPKVLAKHQEVIKNEIYTFSYCPGYTKTRLTGNKGNHGIEKAAQTPVFLSELSPEEIKFEKEQGGFFQNCQLSSL